MRFLAAVACFSDHAHANRLPKRRPELWPVDGSGRRIAQKEWFVGVVPTFEDHREDRLALLPSSPAATTWTASFSTSSAGRSTGSWSAAQAGGSRQRPSIRTR